MFSTSLKELEAARMKVADLEKAVAAERDAELRTLPAKYGFDSVAAFASAVRAASGARRGRPAGSGAKGASKKRRKRAVVTDEIRAQVKKLSEEKKSGAFIAKEVGVSLPTVQNIRKALGLVKERKK